MFWQNGAIVERLDGANAPALTKLMEKYSRLPSTSSSIVSNTLNQSPNELFDSRLRSLTTMAETVLFMKGTASKPECGFSRQIVKILNDLSIPYTTFNILTDDAVRQGLKEFAQWPTYPQLWRRGELVGGLDIVKEMVANGELKATEQSTTLEPRLDSLTKQASVMIFIKGSPDAPQCGFSRQLVSILDDFDVTYKHFDILSDDEVRQGLKIFSQWPTFPQVYIKGEFIGGLDIVKEMVANGEFQQSVSGLKQ